MKLRLLALVLLTVAVGGCNSRSHRPQPTTSSVVPWIDRPLPLYSVPPPRPIPYATSAPLCHARQLRVTQGPGGAAAGTYYEKFKFGNTSRTTCLLRGFPTITAIGPLGVRRPLRLERSTGIDNLATADIRPGGYALLDIATPDGCAAGLRGGVHYRRPVFRLPQDGSVPAGDRFAIIDDCGLLVSNFGLPLRVALAVAAPGTPGRLRAQLLVPRTVRAGKTLRYTVTLRNTTAIPITMRSCPGYTPVLSAPLPIVSRSYSLNCATHHVIPAHGQVRFAMQFAVPRGETPVLADIAWTLDTPTGPGVSARIRIVAA